MLCQIFMESLMIWLKLLSMYWRFLGPIWSAFDHVHFPMDEGSSSEAELSWHMVKWESTIKNRWIKEVEDLKRLVCPFIPHCHLPSVTSLFACGVSQHWCSTTTWQDQWLQHVWNWNLKKWSHSVTWVRYMTQSHIWPAPCHLWCCVRP